LWEARRLLAKRNFAQNNKLAFKKEIAHPASMVLEILLFCRDINGRVMRRKTKAPPGYPDGAFIKKEPPELAN